MTQNNRPFIPLDVFLLIAERDAWTCHWCEVGYLPNDPWETDHKRSLRNGGTNHLFNLALCHSSCNRDKGALSVAAS